MGDVLPLYRPPVRIYQDGRQIGLCSGELIEGIGKNGLPVVQFERILLHLQGVDPQATIDLLDSHDGVLWEGCWFGEWESTYQDMETQVMLVECGAFQYHQRRPPHGKSSPRAKEMLLRQCHAHLGQPQPCPEGYSMDPKGVGQPDEPVTPQQGARLKALAEEQGVTVDELLEQVNERMREGP